MSLRVSNNNGYTIGYDDGINYADGRVNTSSINYQSGYNSGISYADSRVNESSISYTSGYNNGYDEGSSNVTIDGESVKDKMELVSAATDLALEETPVRFEDFVVIDDKIYTVQYGTAYTDCSLYSFNGNVWSLVSASGARGYGGLLLVHHGKIHLLGNSSYTSTGSVQNDYDAHYVWDGSAWTKLRNLPYRFQNGCAVVFNDEIHIFGGYDSSNSYNKHYKWDESGDTWTNLGTTPVDLRYARYSAVVYNGVIYAFDGNNRVQYDGTKWTNNASVAYKSNYCGAIVYEGKIHVLGGEDTDDSSHYVNYKHYSFDGNWSAEKSLPYRYYNKRPIVYHNAIHMIGGNGNTLNYDGTYTEKKHYILDGQCFLSKSHNLARVVLNRDLWLTNVPFDYNNLLIAVYADGYKKVVDATTCSVSEGAIFTDAGVINITASYTDGEITKSVSSTINVSESVSWSLGSDEDINKIVKLMDDGVFTPQQVGWQVGDTRTVHLSAMDATNVGESHVEQDVNLVIMNVGGKTLTNGKTCNFVVGQKEPLIEQGYVYKTKPTTASWSGSNRRTWCNNEYKNAFPGSIRGIFKQFKNIGYLGSNTDDYFALPSDREVTGTGDVSSDTWFEFYKTAENRKKQIPTEEGQFGVGWWTRTPINAGSQSDYYGLVNKVDGSGSTSSIITTLSTLDHGIVPFGCI